MPCPARLTLCAVVDPATSRHNGVVQRALTAVAEAALARAMASIAPCEAELEVREGAPIRALLDEVIGRRALLVAVGSCARSRATGFALGSVARAMLRDAPCSVLIVHGAGRADRAASGDAIVAVDGSDSAPRALAAGQELVERLSLTLRVVVSGDGDRASSGWWQEHVAPEHVLHEGPRPALEALVAASATARLLILGGQHRRAAPALADPTERVVRRAGCPVLIVQ